MITQPSHSLHRAAILRSTCAGGEGADGLDGSAVTDEVGNNLFLVVCLQLAQS